MFIIIIIIIITAKLHCKSAFAVETFTTNCDFLQAFIIML